MTGDAGPFVDAPHLGDETTAHGRRVVALHEQELHAVGQHLRAHLHLLSARHHRYEERWQHGGKQSSVHTTPFHQDTESSTPSPSRSIPRSGPRFPVRRPH